MLHINCLALDNPGSEPFNIDVEDDILAAYFKAYVYQQRQYFYTAHHADQTDLMLYIPSHLSIEPIGNLHERANHILKSSRRVQENEMLTSAISDNLVEGRIHVLVDASHIVERPESLDLDWTVEMRHTKTLKLSKNASSPSEAALPGHMPSQQSRCPIYNGRSDNFRGPPISIYCSVFAELKDTLKDLSSIEVTAQEIKAAHALVMRSVKFYEYDGHRMEQTDIQLENLLGFSIANIAPGDGLIREHIQDQVALLACLRWRNELGSVGDAGYHAACSYREYAASKEYETVRKRTCSPAMIVSIMGPYLCLWGAIFVDEIIVQPFTDYIFLGGNPDYGDRVLHVARIFKAAKNALHNLQQYYEEFLAGDGRQGQHLPRPSFADKISSGPSLHYFDRLFPDDPAKTLFVAKMDRRDVVVKFTVHYCGEAHQLLASHGLAPQLHFCKRIRGGLWMVVMDYVPGETSDMFLLRGQFTTDILSDIRKAVELLHREGYVFGDLRLRNILVVRKMQADAVQPKPDGVTYLTRGGDSPAATNDKYANRRFRAVLVDFDWCGRDSEARYPPTLNDTGDIDWAPGVERLGLMKKEHDEYLLRKLISHEPSMQMVLDSVRGTVHTLGA
ncbi:hypothetical protein ACEPAF_1926 [Sanghuangporus sanghuang]